MHSKHQNPCGENPHQERLGGNWEKNKKKKNETKGVLRTPKKGICLGLRNAGRSDSEHAHHSRQAEKRNSSSANMDFRVARSKARCSFVLGRR